MHVISYVELRNMSLFSILSFSLIVFYMQSINLIVFSPQYTYVKYAQRISK